MKRHGGSWVSHVPLKKVIWKIAGTSVSVPIDITDDTLASSLVPVQCASLAPPAANSEKQHPQKSRSQKDQIAYGQTKQWKQTSSGRSFTSIQMFHTHKRKSSYLSKATERSQWASHDVSHCDFCTCESWDGEGPCTFPAAASQFDPRISPMAQEAVEHKQQGSEKRLWATLGRSTCHCSNSSASHLDVSYCTSMVSMWICMWCGP